MSSSNMINNKNSFASLSASPTSPKQLNKDTDLAVIEEELQVEEGCENELELSRVTIQKIRQRSNK